MAPTTRLPAAANQTCNQPVLLPSVRKAFVLAVFLATALVLPLRAQFFDASDSVGPATITAPWRFHTGDNPQWAAPNFDDSQWSLLRIAQPLSVQGYAGFSGYGWYRIRLQLPAGKEPLALGIARVQYSAEIYADGKLIGLIGRMRPTPDFLSSLPNIVVIPLPAVLSGRTIELAIRIWESPIAATIQGTLGWSLPVLGTEQAVRALHNLTVHQSLFGELPAWLVALVAVVIGQMSFGLFLLRKRATEYAWAGLYLFCEAAIIGLFLFSQVHELPVKETELAYAFLQTGTWVCWLSLAWGFMRTRADWLLRTGILLAFTPPICISLINGRWMTVPNYYVVYASVALCIGILIFVRLVHEARKGNRDAQIFLLPFLLNSVMDAVSSIFLALFGLGLYRSQVTARGGGVGGPARGGYFTVTLEELGALLSYLAIGAVLVRRFTRSAEQEQRLASEMDSARQVQAQLVPLDFPHLAGFQIEAAYLPASEVGGDFYQVLEQCDGSVLIVIGDVCGKGLKAAMTGVLAIGAVRALASQGPDPGLLLRRLNSEIARSHNDGFITCICAHVRRDGAVTFADAGHPPPYRNGEEIDVQSNLPLGITPDVEYAETHTQLAVVREITSG